MSLSLGRPRILAAVGVVAAIIWFLAPGPKAPEQRAQPTEPWQISRDAAASAPGALQTLAKAALWGNLPDAPSTPSLNDPDWRFVGIVRSGAERFVLIKVEGQPERKLTVNDILPGGSRILSIEEDSLCILVDGSKRKLGIYKTGPQIL